MDSGSGGNVSGSGEPLEAEFVDLMTFEELVDALKETKSRKVAGPGGMNSRS